MERTDACYEPIRLPEYVATSREQIFGLVSRNKHRFWTKVNAYLLTFFAQLCRLDFHSYYNFHWSAEVIEVDKSRSKENRDISGSNSSGSNSSRSNWSLMALIYYVYLATKLGLNMYFQYVYDYHLYQLEYLQIRSANSLQLQRIPIGSPGNQIIEQIKLDKLMEAERSLKQLGAPFYKTSYFVEIAYGFALTLSFIIYMNGQVFFNLFFPVDFRFARLIKHPEREQLNYIQCVCQEVNKFINSSRNFSSTYLNCLDVNFQRLISTRSCVKQEHQPNWANEEPMLAQMNCLRQLKRLALNDQLRPLNWSPGWIERLSTYYCLFTVTCLTWGTSILVVTAVASPFVSEADFETFSRLDYLMIFENIMIILYLIFAMTFYTSVVFVSCTDQVMYINKLRSLIRQRLGQNQMTHIRLLDSWRLLMREKQEEVEKRSDALPSSLNGRPSWMLMRDELQLGTMNCNLLYCFMHYKIFVGQFKTHRRTFELISLHAILVWFVLPIIARLHAPYQDQASKMLQVYVCVAICVIINFVLVPICHLYSCSAHLYRTLSGLLASTIETQSIYVPEVDLAKGNLRKSGLRKGSLKEGDHHHHHQTVGSRKSLYNLHLLALLRKELNEPEIFMSQFATKSIGIHISYPSLVKIHFWFGVILLSLISDVTTGHDSLFGSSLSDPFGLFA